MSNKIELKIGNGRKIVVENYHYSDDFPNEISVYVCDDNNVIIQDICMVRQHYEHDREKGCTKVDDELIDCIVWADCGNEDYTHKFVIEQWKYEEDE